MDDNKPLPGWNEGAAKAAIVAFVEQTVADAVPVEERIAVFDADGTLWCEQPVPVEADFILRRLAEMAKADPTLRDRQPWKAAYEHDNDWLGRVVARRLARPGRGRDDARRCDRPGRPHRRDEGPRTRRRHARHGPASDPTEGAI
jgi:hypothetical protein